MSDLHQYLSVATPNSSSHRNLESPKSETSMSLKAASTDPEYRSSPSTSYTSAYESDSGVDGGSYTNVYIAAKDTNNTSGIEVSGAAGLNVSPSSRTWRMPFAKGSAPPRALSTTSPSNANNSSSPQRRRKASSSSKTFRLSTTPQWQEDDGSFVETTSEKAAQALAKYWNDVQAHSDVHGKGRSSVATGVNDYVVVARVENGKQIYKIRPRSRPPTVAETGKRPEHVPQSTKLQAASASLQMPPSIRLTRSIPILRTRVSDETALSPISRDKDGFYRPAGSSAGQPIENGFLALPVESSYHVLRTENTSGQLRKSLLQNAVSIPNLRAHRDNDIFGKLLGWSDPSNPVLDAPTSGPSRPSPTSKSSRSPPRDIASSHTAEASSAHARPSFEGGLHTPLNQSFPYDLPPDLHEASQSSIQQREVLKSTPTSSPFGQGVRLPSQPRLKRKKSLRQLHGTIMAPAAEERANNTFDSLDSFDPSFKVRAIREVGSSETIRTAKGPNMPSAGEPDMPPLDSPRTPLAVPSLDTWMSDTRIFDSLQCNDSTAPVGELRDSLKPTSEASGRRHERGISNTSLVSLGGSSLHSASSAASAGEQAHTITVTSVPGDDRRFVIWGRRPGPPSQTPARPTSDSRMSPASFTSSSSFSSSKRSSNQRRYDNTEQLTPPTSASSSSSPWSSGPPVQKVLLAATVDRWIADMTSRIENDLMTDFFLTYRCFLAPISLCKLLITRFEWALQPGHNAEDIAGRRIVRVRTYVVFRHWLLNYFHEDFVPDRELRLLLTAWLNRMGKDERLRPNPTDLRLIKSLKKVVKRLKAAYSTIGIDQAADATALIKTSLETDPQLRSRLRSDSMASVSSLHSIREEQADATDSKGVSDNGEQSVPSASIDAGQQTHVTRQNMRTSSSEDDVDLEIEIHVSGYDSDELPRIPPIIPISPPRRRQYSPSQARKSRSPSIGTQDRPSRPIEGLTLIPDNHRVSRAIATTVGSFSKLRRMMGNRRQPGHPSGSSPRYYNDAYPSTTQLSAMSPDQSTEPTQRMSLAKSGDGPDKVIDAAALDIRTESSSSSSPRASTPIAASSTPNLRHTASSGTMRRQSSRSAMLGKSNSIESLQGRPGNGSLQKLAPAASIRNSGIQLDDYDSSGDESNFGGPLPVRTLRRLPAARDLRRGKAGDHIALSHRHSIDSIASYATRRLPSCALEPIPIPSIAAYDYNPSSMPEQDVDAMLDQGLIPYFVPPTDSDDDDEPGDVEAALRRLEGQVDDAKQQSNARKVERYLKMSEQAKSNGGYVYGEDGEASDEEMSVHSRPASLAVSVRDENNLHQLEEKEAKASEVQIQDSQTLLPDQPDAHSAYSPEQTLRVPDQNTGSPHGKRTLQRKSSMRRFFGGTMSISLWPTNNAVSKIPKARIPQPPTYRSFIFSFKVEALAKHFCIIERDLLEKITWQELIGSRWKERLDLDDFSDWDTFMKIRAKLNSEAQEQAQLPYSSVTQLKRLGDVQTIIHRFNLMCKWIASEIVLTTSTAERALLLTKIIKLAFKSYQMYNFQTTTQIVHALQLPSIERLKKTWGKVPSFELRLFSQLKFFCSPLRDFRLLREATGGLASQWGPPGQEDRDPDMALPGIPGALPFFGLILRDLAMSHELPTFLDPSNPRSPAEIDELTMLLPSYADPSEFSDLPPLPEGLPLRPLINIHKYRTIAKTIQLVMTFKELAGTYPYEPELPLYRKCLTIQCLPMQKITELSLACER